ncbi:MAG TPA: NUDIX hydrolase, partial [Candidatus Saccharimonadales bacterium]|nr:NUDIX hydrolase [Candidatus Saccharimonadales bacterium]
MYNLDMIRRVAVRGIIVSNGKLLCARLKAYGGKQATDYWCVPGGGIDIGEAAIPALEREIFEETGVKPSVGSLLYLQQYPYEHGEQMEFFFHIKNPKDFIDIDLSKTSHGEEEIAEIDFVEPASTNILPKFLTTESFDNLEKQPTKVFNYL